MLTSIIIDFTTKNLLKTNCTTEIESYLELPKILLVINFADSEKWQASGTTFMKTLRKF
jgi:hypothetical protein